MRFSSSASRRGAAAGRVCQVVALDDQVLQLLLQTRPVPATSPRRGRRAVDLLLHLGHDHGRAPADALLAAQDVAVGVVAEVEDLVAAGADASLQEEGVAARRSSCPAVGQQRICVPAAPARPSPRARKKPGLRAEQTTRSKRSSQDPARRPPGGPSPRRCSRPRSWSAGRAACPPARNLRRVGTRSGSLQEVAVQVGDDARLERAVGVEGVDGVADVVEERAGSRMRQAAARWSFRSTSAA